MNQQGSFSCGTVLAFLALDILLFWGICLYLDTVSSCADLPGRILEFRLASVLGTCPLPVTQAGVTRVQYQQLNPEHSSLCYAGPFTSTWTASGAGKAQPAWVGDLGKLLSFRIQGYEASCALRVLCPVTGVSAERAHWR